MLSAIRFLIVRVERKHDCFRNFWRCLTHLFDERVKKICVGIRCARPINHVEFIHKQLVTQPD